MSLLGDAINVTTRQHTEQPIKPSVIPDKRWEEVCIDFGGPYPDGHYNLVAVDKRTRYPEVEVVSSTLFEPTKAKLKQMFGHHGIPQRNNSDNEPPFNSKEFSHFADQEGFIHHGITPEHPRANGEAERFMQLLNKLNKLPIYKARANWGDKWQYKICSWHRDTPHPATGVTPYEAMLNCPIRTRLDHEKPSSTAQSTKDQLIDNHDNQYKERMKKYQRNAKEHEFKLGDYVLLKQQKSNK